MRTLSTSLLVCYLLALPGFGQEEMPEVARSLMEEASAAKDANRTDEAIAKYTRVIEVAPALASAYVNLGAIYFNQKKADQAYATFVKGLQNAPADRTLLSNAAAAAQQLGKSADALKYIDRAIEKSSKDAALHSLRGTILRSLGRNDDALAALQQAAVLAPDDAKVQFSLGNQLYQMGRKDEAINAYGRAVALDKTLMRAYYNLGAVLFESGRYDEALQAYKVALAPIEQSFTKGEKIDPIHARAYANLGGIYLKQQQWQPAIDAYQKSLRLDAKNPNAHYNLGFLYFTTNQPQRAEEEYRTALAADSSLPLAYLHLGTMAYRRGEYDKAAQLLRDGLPHYDRDARLSALKTLARAELARSKRPEAKEALEGALKEKGDDLEALLLLGRLQRQSEAYPDAKATLDRAHGLAPQNNVITLERLLVAKATGDLATERIAAEALLAREPQRAAPLNAEYNNVLLRQGDIAAARKAGALRGPFANAVADALDGKREPAARALAQLGTPIARGDAGLLWWQLGRPADARPQLNAAHASFGDWNEVTLAEGEIALADHRYSDAIDKLTLAKCDAPQPSGVSGTTVLISMGRSDDLCARTKDALAIALVSQAASEIANGSMRAARSLLDRVNDDRLRAIALYLRGRAEIDEGGRDSISRAVSLGLPSALEAMAKRDLDATEPAPNEPAEPVAATPHRTVVVFLPDVPAESDKKLAETMNALVAQWSAAANVPLQVELFRRADDARNFVLNNRDKVGVVIANPDFARALDLSPRFAFTRGGATSYRRVVVVPSKSSSQTLADLKGKTISAAEGLGDGGVNVTTLVPDDLTALANALFGKTDAALVNEANPLLAQHTRDLREIHSTTASLPVYAFAAMPAADRTALYDAVNPKALAPLQMGVTRIMKERPKKDLSPISVSALGLPRLAEPPQNLALRLTLELPTVVINEDLFGKP
jgi:tetratricopeptide (TPR) repeat protein